MSRMRRSKLEIIISILHAAMNDANATHLMYRANLNYSQIQSYLKLLIRNDLISVTGSRGNKIYRTTPKGKLLINHLDKIEDFYSFKR